MIHELMYSIKLYLKKSHRIHCQKKVSMTNQKKKKTIIKFLYLILENFILFPTI